MRIDFLQVLRAGHLAAALLPRFRILDPRAMLSSCRVLPLVSFWVHVVSAPG